MIYLLNMVFVQFAMLVYQRVLENMNPTEARKFGHPPESSIPPETSAGNPKVVAKVTLLLGT